MLHSEHIPVTWSAIISVMSSCIAVLKNHDHSDQLTSTALCWGAALYSAISHSHIPMFYIYLFMQYMYKQLYIVSNIFTNTAVITGESIIT